VGASSEFHGHRVMNAIDGIGDLRWRCVGSEQAGSWIQIDFPKRVQCNVIVMRARTDRWYREAAAKFQIWGSNDGSTFHKFDVITATWSQGEWKCFPVSPGSEFAER
jgi:hypothetical protein